MGDSWFRTAEFNIMCWEMDRQSPRWDWKPSLIVRIIIKLLWWAACVWCWLWYHDWMSGTSIDGQSVGDGYCQRCGREEHDGGESPQYHRGLLWRLAEFWTCEVQSRYWDAHWWLYMRLRWMVCFFRGHVVKSGDIECVAGCVYHITPDYCERCCFNADDLDFDEPFTLRGLWERGLQKPTWMWRIQVAHCKHDWEYLTTPQRESQRDDPEGRVHFSNSRHCTKCKSWEGLPDTVGGPGPKAGLSK